MHTLMLVHTAVLIAAVGACAPKGQSFKPARDYRVVRPIVPVESTVIPPDEQPWQDAGNGIRRKVYFNDRLTVALIEVSDGDTRPAPPVHKHAHDQIGYVMEGRALVTLGDRTREIGPGGVYVVTSNMPHGLKPLTSRLVLLEAFTPTREDFRIRPTQ